MATEQGTSDSVGACRIIEAKKPLLLFRSKLMNQLALSLDISHFFFFWLIIYFSLIR